MLYDSFVLNRGKDKKNGCRVDATLLTNYFFLLEYYEINKEPQKTFFVLYVFESNPKLTLKIKNNFY